VPALAALGYLAADRETAGLERLGSRVARGLLLAGAALLAYSLVRALLVQAFGGKVPLAADLLLSAACIVAAVPGYSRLKKTVDPLFMRTGYDPARVVTEFARAAREAYDPDLIVGTFYDGVRDALGCTAGVVYLTSQGGLTPVVAEGCAVMPAAINGDGPNLSWLVPGQPMDPGRHPGGAAGLALPFIPKLALALAVEDLDEEGPIGLVVLGPRDGDRPYGAADRDLVMELGRIMARGVQTTRLLSRRAAEDRQRRELEVAWEVQANLLPRELPALEGADLEAYARSAREVGGDFYDVLQVDANRWGILVGEATGRGIASALLAEVTLSFFRSAAPGTPSPAEALRIVNNLICLYRPSLRASVTVSYAVYDRRDRSLAVSNAGQAHPLLNGYPVAIDGVPLGVGRDAAFAENRLTLKKGDAVLWYTDGVPGAENDAGKAFGQERLLTYARDERLRDAEEPWRLRELLRWHVGEAEQSDDMTYLLLMVR
ncbi:MAG: SpoIIE family protein phosphatase, partial [Candidatus Sericytochromatia bacterium]|nr:SpoIIE family protein phosphatase [Candidatus Tanganyikabacteria bacterium]